MKRKDFEKCLICEQGVMSKNNNPLFYRVKVDAMVIDLGAVQRTHGMELMFGGGVAGANLASAMGDDPDLASPIESFEVLLCQNCALKTELLSIISLGQEKARKEESGE